MLYEIGVYGDSIAFGYGNYNQSWFDLLSRDFSSSIKLAKNGEKIGDILNKLQKDCNHYSTLILAVGINDLLLPSPQEKVATNFLQQQYEQILQIAQNKAQNVVIQSILPVREELFPKQDWLETDKWCYNSHVEQFNNQLKAFNEKYNTSYFDVYTEFLSLSLGNLYIDAVHLNQKGQDLLYKFYSNNF